MSFNDVLPNVQALSRSDKVRLFQFLAQELEIDLIARYVERMLSLDQK